MSGHWPPEWEDQEEEFGEEADQLDTTAPASEGEARLSEVAAYLATVPAPVLPDIFETRIHAALAAEAATRAEQAAPVDSSRTLGPTPTRMRLRRPRGGGGPRRDRSRSLLAAGSLVVCLLLAGLGFALSRGTSTDSGSSSGVVAGSSFAAGSGSSAGGGVASAPRSPSAVEPENASSSGAFVVTESGTSYQQATLAGQVRARLAVIGGLREPLPSPSSASAAVRTSATPVKASASATSVALTPGRALQGCVLHLTGGALPQLVDRATYQGAPAYVIATSGRVWVVGLGCTATKTELITSVPLAGLPGISAP
jgi:hypothetical protein